MARTDVQKDRCRNCGTAPPPAGSHADRITVGLQKCARDHTMTRGCLPPGAGDVYTFIFLHFGTINVAERRHGSRVPGADWRRRVQRRRVHVNDFSEGNAQHLTGLGTRPAVSSAFRACRFRAWPRRTSSRGSRADRRSIRHRLRPLSEPARACCARRRRGCRPCHSLELSASSSP